MMLTIYTETPRMESCVPLPSLSWMSALLRTGMVLSWPWCLLRTGTVFSWPWCLLSTGTVFSCHFCFIFAQVLTPPSEVQIGCHVFNPWSAIQNLPRVFFIPLSASVCLSLSFSVIDTCTHTTVTIIIVSLSVLSFFLFWRGCVGPANNAPQMRSRVKYPRILCWFLFHWLCNRGEPLELSETEFSLCKSGTLTLYSSWQGDVRKAWKIDKTVFFSNPNMCSWTPVWCLLLTWSCSICVFPSSTEDKTLGLGHLGQVC